MMALPPEWQTQFDAMHTLREQRGYVWLGSMEADPRAPGGDHLLWGRKPDNALEVCIVEEDGTVHTWEAIDEDEWRRRWPHASVPAAILAGE